jgi:glutathione S-transferase
MPALQKTADAAGAAYAIVNDRLAERTFLEGEEFTLADLAVAAFTRRWLGVEGVDKPHHEHLLRWYDRISARPGFQRFIAPDLT